MALSVSNEIKQQTASSTSASVVSGSEKATQTSSANSYLGVNLQDVKELMSSLAQSQGRVPVPVGERQQALSRHLDAIEKRQAKPSPAEGNSSSRVISSLISRIVGKYPEINEEISKALNRESLSNLTGDKLAAEVSRNLANLPKLLQSDTSAGKALLEFVAQAAVAKIDEKSLSDNWKRQISDSNLSIIKNTTPRQMQEVGRVLDDSMKFIYKNQSNSFKANSGEALLNSLSRGSYLGTTTGALNAQSTNITPTPGKNVTYLNLFSQTSGVKGEAQLSPDILNKINNIITKAAQLAIDSNLIDAPDEALSQIIESEDFSLQDLKFVNNLITRASNSSSTSSQLMSKAALMRASENNLSDKVSVPPRQFSEAEIKDQIKQHMETIHNSNDLKTIEQTLQKINELNKQLANLKSQSVINEATRPPLRESVKTANTPAGQSGILDGRQSSPASKNPTGVNTTTAQLPSMTGKSGPYTSFATLRQPGLTVPQSQSGTNVPSGLNNHAATQSQTGLALPQNQMGTTSPQGQSSPAATQSQAGSQMSPGQTGSVLANTAATPSAPGQTSKAQISGQNSTAASSSDHTSQIMGDDRTRQAHLPIKETGKPVTGQEPKVEYQFQSYPNRLIRPRPNIPQTQQDRFGNTVNSQSLKFANANQSPSPAPNSTNSATPGLQQNFATTAATARLQTTPEGVANTPQSSATGVESQNTLKAASERTISPGADGKSAAGQTQLTSPRQETTGNVLLNSRPMVNAANSPKQSNAPANPTINNQAVAGSQGKTADSSTSNTLPRDTLSTTATNPNQQVSDKTAATSAPSQQISSEASEKLNFFRKITHFFKPLAHHPTLDKTVANQTNIPEADPAKTKIQQSSALEEPATPKAIRQFRHVQSTMPQTAQVATNAQSTGFSTLMEDLSNGSMHPQLRAVTRQIENIFNQSLASTPAIMQWLNYVDNPLSGNNNFSKGLRAWATMLVSLRFKQLGINQNSGDNAKQQVMSNWQMNSLIDDGEQWPQNSLHHLAEHVDKMQQNQQQRTDPLWANYIPLPTVEDNQKENCMSFKRNRRKDQTDSIDLQFYFEIKGLGPIGLKVSYAKPDISVKATAETYEGYSKIKETMHLLEDRFRSLSMNCHDFNCSKGRVTHPAGGDGGSTPSFDSDADGLNLRI